MKLRDGFVSNSSSASFVVSFSSSLSVEEISNLICKADEWLAKKWSETKGQRLKAESFQSGNFEYEDIEVEPMSSNLQKNGDKYTFTASTTMFNDWYDVPGAKFFRALSENRIPDISNVEIIQTEDEMDTISKKVEFDPYCWEYETNIIHPWGDPKKKEKKEAESKQFELEMEFLEYLSSIGSQLTQEQEIQLAKYQLSK